MRTIWTTEEASYHGEFVDFDPIWCYPKPVQKPHPPIYLGAVSKAGLKRVVDFCDGWLLVDPNDDSLERAAIELDELCTARGRDPREISITVFATQSVDAALVERYAAAGVDRLNVWLPPDSPDDALRVLDAAAPLVERYA